MDRAILEEVVRRLSGAAGIDPESLEMGRITWTVDSRCRHLGLTSATDYVEVLRSSKAELDELIDALVIQETRFFRDTAVFENIRTWAQEAAGAVEGPLRILSAPCSTGQEAYSAAAMLHCAGLSPSRFTIDAYDISRAALVTAQRGIYSAGALDNIAPEFQIACGVFRNQHWHMHDAIRNRIRFERRNLVEAKALGDEARYHLILCRNLFIYLHAEARAVLAESLSRALLPGGRLIVGAGDRVAELNARFVPVKPAAGFGFVHRTETRAAVTRVAVRAAAPVAVREPRRVHVMARADEPQAPSSAVEFYERAVEYMDRGNLRQAERRCRQALYLAPHFLPALELLQALWHMHPNPRLRRALTARIERVRGDAMGDAVLAEGGAL